MANLSKAVADRLKISRSVTHAIETRGEEVAHKVTAVLFPGEVPEQITPAAFVAALGHALVRAGETLEQADLDHAAELADDPQVRDARDHAQSELSELLQRVRGIVTAAYGGRSLKKVGLDQPLPRDAQALLQLGRHVSSRLDEQTLGEPTDDLIPVDLEQLRKRVVDKALALETGLSDTERERREAQQTVEQRDKATDEWGRVYGGIADTFVALAELAGFAELAERIKPTSRRRSGRTEPADEVADENADPEPPQE